MRLLTHPCKEEIAAGELSVFRSTGIYPYNTDADLKNLPELNTNENRTGTPVPNEPTSTATSSTAVATDPTPKTPPPKRTTDLLPHTTPHNAIGVKYHVEVVLEEFDSLDVGE